MKINIVTLFPDFFKGALEASLLGKAQKNKIIQLNIIDLRAYGVGKHKTVDDKPYSGGPGLILRPDIADLALKNLGGKKIITSASGKLYNQKIAQSLAKEKEITILCPRYEGFDERILNFVDLELSVGNYVLSGGEPAAMVIIDSIARLLPGFMHKKDSLSQESFNLDSEGKVFIEAPQYTRPPIYNNLAVPEILISGDHKKIAQFYQIESLKKKQKNRPDLI